MKPSTPNTNSTTRDNIRVDLFAAAAEPVTGTEMATRPCAVVSPSTHSDDAVSMHSSTKPHNPALHLRRVRSPNLLAVKTMGRQVAHLHASPTAPTTNSQQLAAKRA